MVRDVLFSAGTRVSLFERRMQLMSNATTWANEGYESKPEQKFASARRTAQFLIFVFLVILAACALNLLQHTSAMANVTDRMDKITRWVPLVGAIGAVAGTLALLGLLSRFRALQSEWSDRVKSFEKLSAVSQQSLQAQFAGERVAREQLERKNSEIAARNAFLEEELDKRKRSEKTLHEQQRELARSRDVLEIHIRERTQAIEKLRHRYELILNSAGEGICGLDANGKATYVNPAATRMTGFDAKELIGLPESEIFGATFSATGTSPSGTKMEDHTFRRRDGSTFIVELVKTPIVENDREVGAVLIFKDITARRKAEEDLARKADELTRSNAELEQFAFVASHDLQEPLRKIQAFGDRVKTKCEKIDLGEAGDYLNRMQNAAARMQTLINDLLAFSRVIRSSQPFVPVNLAAITKEVLNDLEVRIEKNGARVEVGSLPTISGDPTQMRQLMQNLLSNALKFQPAGKQPIVTISSRIIPDVAGNESATAPDANPLWEISVQDNGIGFDEKHLEKIFAVFQRLHGRTEYEGTGIGLAVCRRILDRHGGSITARSSSGNGATFVFTVPSRSTEKEEAI
jgi:two-component system, LuxR family, sensor kinase FixL